METRLKLTHKFHQSLVESETKNLLGEKVWFHGIDAFVEKAAKDCLAII